MMTPEQVRSFSWYRGNLKWLPERTIMLGRHGSQAYGTNTPTSDLDLKGVAVAPREYYLGFLNAFEQAECAATRDRWCSACNKMDGHKIENCPNRPAEDPPDAVIYDIRKFFKLAADCNPNIIEMLFLDEQDLYVPFAQVLGTFSWKHFPQHKEWAKVIDNRDLFLSTRAEKTFSGYAVAQLKRIRTHRRWLLNPPNAEPRREDFGLKSGQGTVGKEQLGVVESRIRKRADELGGQGWTKDRVEAFDDTLVESVIIELALDADLIPLVIAERRYGNAVKTWNQYQTWKEERNEKRQALEAAHGYDTKHGMHLVRLLRMAREILSGEGVKVRRPDAEELLAIRNGAWSFDKIEAWALEQEAALAPIAKASKLPHQPDRNKLDAVLVSVVEAML